MPTLMFHDRFAPPIRSGRKRQTIRKDAVAEPGDTLYLRRWTAAPYRSKQEEIIPAAPCEACQPIDLSGDRRRNLLTITLGNLILPASEVRHFVRDDGFESIADFLGYWGDRTEFTGYLISW